MNTKSKLPRGIRNNNPLNIRIGNNWQGEVAKPTDLQFEQFTEMKYGVRAAFKLLHNYIERYKLNTIEKIVRRWAPSSENNTEAYIKHVCEWTGFGRTQVLHTNKPFEMLWLLIAMGVQESTQMFAEQYFDDVLEGWLLYRKS